MDLAKRNTLTWIAITVILFPILVVAGVFLRFVQGNTLGGAREWFYPMMTLHGVGMVGVWYVAGMACVERIIAKYTRPSDRMSFFAIVGTVIGVVLLLVSVLIGKFAAGWYFLYPLPLQASWPTWSTVVFLVCLTVLGATWLLWSLSLLRAIAREYTLPKALAWHYLAGKSEPEVPPAIVITTVSLIAGIASLLSAVIVLVLFYAEMLTGTVNDALLMKNLTFFFGHTLVNISLYLGVAVIYELLPQYCGRPWKTNKIVAISWNSVLAIVMFAYFHHLYMDFVQPTTFQYIGQIASYMSSLPAAVVTIFGALLLVFHANMKWNVVSVFLFVGMLGWAIGGVAAVIDSTIAVNFRFHNTLWVPAHFHTYMLEGLVLMVLGYVYHYLREESRLAESHGLQKTMIGLIVAGGFGFVLMFYLAGASGVPRRFAVYPLEVANGAPYSLISAGFAVLFCVGIGLFISETGKCWFAAARS
jgi:cytochrome c oxidase subunit 1